MMPEKLKNLKSGKNLPLPDDSYPTFYVVKIEKYPPKLLQPSQCGPLHWGWMPERTREFHILGDSLVKFFVKYENETWKRSELSKHHLPVEHPKIWNRRKFLNSNQSSQKSKKYFKPRNTPRGIKFRKSSKIQRAPREFLSFRRVLPKISVKSKNDQKAHKLIDGSFQQFLK